MLPPGCERRIYDAKYETRASRRTNIVRQRRGIRVCSREISTKSAIVGNVIRNTACCVYHFKTFSDSVQWNTVFFSSRTISSRNIP